MQAPPDWQIALWPKPNMVNPVLRGNAKVITNLVLYPIVLLFVLLRIYTRIFHLKVNTFSLDDTLILLAMIPATAFFIFSLLADLHFHWVEHVYDLPVDSVETGLKLVLATQLVFALACTLTKLSMLFLTRRVLASATIFWRRATLFAIWIVGIQGLVFEITIIFQCRPPQHYWQVVPHPQPECVDQTVLLLVAGIVNTITDFLVVLLPFKTVLELDLPRRQKMIIIGLFALGLLSGAAGVARTYYTYAATAFTLDATWASFPVWITAAVELYVGLICASIPATKPFFSTYIPKLISHSGYTARSKSPHSLGNRISQMRVRHMSGNTVTSSSPGVKKSYLLSPISFSKTSTSSATTKVNSRTSVTPSPSLSSASRKGDEAFVSLSSVTSNEKEISRKEMEQEFQFQYGIPEEDEDDGDENVELDDFVFMRSRPSGDRNDEDLVVQDGNALNAERIVARNSYKSWVGGDDSRADNFVAATRKSRVQAMSVGFERGFRTSGQGSTFKDFDLERGFT